MLLSRTYKGIIWTNHALTRLKDRKISQHMAYKTIALPDSKKKGKKNGSYEFTRAEGDHKITVVAKRTDKNQWLIVSIWIDPPLKGSIDLRGKNEFILFKIFRDLIKSIFR
jgi:hypothetical protein